MTLTPDKSALAQQIADVLVERITAVPEIFYHSSYHTKEDCFKHLIEPLLAENQGEKQFDTLLESLPPNAAKPLRDRRATFMACFDSSGKPCNKNLSLTTVERYMTDLIKELRNIAQENNQNTTANIADITKTHELSQAQESDNDHTAQFELPTRRVSLTEAAKWFKCDHRTLKKDIKSGKIRARKISDRRWEFDLDQVTGFDPSLRSDADPTEYNKCYRKC